MQPLPAWMRARDGGVDLLLRVQPGARRSALAGLHGERLKIAVQAPPIDGRANEALIEFLGDCLRLRRADFSVDAGASSRDKRVGIRCDPAMAPELARRLMDLI